MRTEEMIETAYEAFGQLACGSWDMETKFAALDNLYIRLGRHSVAFDNMVYRQMGMSPEEVLLALK